MCQDQQQATLTEVGQPITLIGPLAKMLPVLRHTHRGSLVLQYHQFRNTIIYLLLYKYKNVVQILDLD